MIKTTALAATPMECRNLQESVKVLTELLAFERLSDKPGEATLKHPNTHWKLVVHEAGPDAPAKPMHNHWGVRVGGNPRNKLTQPDDKQPFESMRPGKWEFDVSHCPMDSAYHSEFHTKMH